MGSGGGEGFTACILHVFVKDTSDDLKPFGSIFTCLLISFQGMIHVTDFLIMHLSLLLINFCEIDPV